MYQNRNRWISVPKNKQAQQNLNFYSATDDQLIQICIQKGDTFSILVRIFELINNITGSMIDDYEEEEITDPAKLKAVIKMLKKEEKECKKEILSVVLDIRQLFEEALHRGTGVYFFF